MHRKTDTRLIKRIALLCIIVLLVILIIYLCISVCVTGSIDTSTKDEADVISSQSEQVIETTEAATSAAVITVPTENSTVKPTEITTSKSQVKVSESKTKKNKYKTSSKNRTNTYSSSLILPATTAPATEKATEAATTQHKKSSSNINDEKIYDGEFIN